MTIKEKLEVIRNLQKDLRGLMMDEAFDDLKGDAAIAFEEAFKFERKARIAIVDTIDAV